MGFKIDLVHRDLPISVKFPWRVGIVSFMAFPSLMKGEGDTVASIRSIVEDPFFDAVEVFKVSDSQWKQLERPIAGKQVARGFQPDILMGKLDLNSLDAEVRRQAVEAVNREIEIISRRGVEALGLCSGPDPDPEKREEAKNLLVDSLEEICGFASKRGVTVLLEAFDREHDKKLLIGPIDDATKIIERVREKHKNIGLMWDLSHAPMLTESPSDLRRARNFLSHIHIGCSKEAEEGFIDSHPGFNTPGAVNTVNDVAALLQVLLEIDYGKTIGFEVKPEEDQTPKEVIDSAKEVLVEAFKKTVSDVLAS